MPGLRWSRSPAATCPSERDHAGMTETIRFYAVRDEYGAFSNFAPYPVTIDGVLWPTTEHYFQASKFDDPRSRDEIRRNKSPMQAARMGRDRRRKLRGDWDSVKVDVMRKAVLAKFRQHRELRKLLLSTGRATLVEHTAGDHFWGDGGDGSGRNMLGLVLMETRERLRAGDR